MPSAPSLRPQELKGNIRVFCRVRPSLQSEVEGEGSGTEPLATSFPTTFATVLRTVPGELLGRGLEIVVPGSLTGQAPQKHSFAFDKVRAKHPPLGPSTDAHTPAGAHRAIGPAVGAL